MHISSMTIIDMLTSTYKIKDIDLKIKKEKNITFVYTEMYCRNTFLEMKKVQGKKTVN